jgi:hypothetical protein
MRQEPEEKKTRIAVAPQTGQPNALPQVDNIELQEDEEIRWIWTEHPDGRKVVTGYEIVKVKKDEAV